LTNNGKSNTGEGSGAHGFCEPPQQPLRWSQGLTVPLQCFRVELVVHRQPGNGPYCLAFEVSDPHTRELLAKWVDPYTEPSFVLPLASAVSVALRGVLLELTDPDPF
jgi:hypothetical protein